MLSRLFIADLWSPIWERTDLLALVGDAYCILFIFTCGVLGRVWCLVVSLIFLIFAISLTLHVSFGLIGWELWLIHGASTDLKWENFNKSTSLKP